MRQLIHTGAGGGEGFLQGWAVFDHPPVNGRVIHVDPTFEQSGSQEEVTPTRPKNGPYEFPRRPLKPFNRSVENAVMPRPTIGYGLVYGSWDAGAHDCLPYRYLHTSARRYDGYAIPSGG